MSVEVMKVAQQPAMAYDGISLSTPLRSGKSGLLLKSLYAYSRPPALALLSVLTLFRDGQLACDVWRQRVWGCISAATRPQLASARTNSGAAESSSSTKRTCSQQSNELRRAAFSGL
jgi:hypothetical protein